MGFNNINKSVPGSTRSPKTSLKEDLEKQESIFERMFDDSAINMQRIDKKILLSGENGTAKSSLAVDSLVYDIVLPEKVPVKHTYEVVKEVVDEDGDVDEEIELVEETVMECPIVSKKEPQVFYVDVDNSGLEIIQSQYKDYYQRRQIRVYNPSYDVTNSGEIKTPEEIIKNIKDAAMAVKEAIDKGYNIRGVVVDGISFLLEHCESAMRINKEKAADEGIPMGAWKIRNDLFKEALSLYMSLPTSVIFVSHEDFVQEAQDKPLASVKQRFIDECSMRIVLTKEQNDNPDVTDYFANVRKNRADVTKENVIYKFMSINHKTDKIDFDATQLHNVIFPVIEAKNVEK